MSTVTPGRMAPVLSATVASMRPVETCAMDGAGMTASSAATAVHDTISLPIRNLISILQDKDRIELRKRTGVRKRTRHYGRRLGGIASLTSGGGTKALLREAVEDVHQFAQALRPFRIALGD